MNGDPPESLEIVGIPRELRQYRATCKSNATIIMLHMFFSSTPFGEIDFFLILQIRPFLMFGKIIYFFTNLYSLLITNVPVFLFFLTNFES